MGLGAWLNRDLVYSVTDTNDSSFSETFVITGPEIGVGVGGPMATDWGVGSQNCYRGGMAIPAAYRAATLRADRLGMFPFHLFRDRAGICEQLPTPGLLEQPSPPMTRMTTLVSLCLDLIWHGNAIAVITSRLADASPAEITPWPAQLVSVRRAPKTGRIEYQIAGTIYDHTDVLHVMGPSAPGQLRGMGVLEAHFRTLELSRELDRQARSVSAHGVPTGVIQAASPDTTPDELRSSKASWLLSQRDRTIAALAPGVTFLPISWNPEETQLIEARKFSLTEIALIFGIPGYWLGAEAASMTYSNVQDEANNLLKYTSVGSDVERFEQALSLLFRRGTYVKANLDAILRPDTKARYETYASGIQAGWLLKSEARALEDLPPVPGIDDAPEPPAPIDPPADPTYDPNADDPPVEA